MIQLSKLKSSDILHPCAAGACEVEISYAGRTFMIAKGATRKGVHYTVRGDTWTGYRFADNLAQLRAGIRAECEP